MNTIIEAIRRASTVHEVSHLLDKCWQEKHKAGFEDRLYFLSELRALLNQIDPIDVAQPDEWSNIQHARVYLHRITAKQSASVK